MGRSEVLHANLLSQTMKARVEEALKDFNASGTV
jgi:hypothetical protein